MKRNYPFVRSASRSVEELSELSLEDQLKILVELRALSGGGLTTPKKFSALSPTARAGYLGDALLDYDKATAYTVRGIPTPVRTADDQVNCVAWDNFSNRLEETLTELNREDCTISPNFIEGGVVIIGYKAPRVAHDPFASGPRLIAVPISRMPGGQDVGESLTRLMSELAALGVRGAHADAKEVEEIIIRHFQDKPASYLQEVISRVEHVASAMETNIDVPRSVSSQMVPYLRKVATVLKERVNLQVC